MIRIRKQSQRSTVGQGEKKQDSPQTSLESGIIRINDNGKRIILLGIMATIFVCTHSKIRGTNDTTKSIRTVIPDDAESPSIVQDDKKDDGLLADRIRSETVDSTRNLQVNEDAIINDHSSNQRTRRSSVRGQVTGRRRIPEQLIGCETSDKSKEGDGSSYGFKGYGFKGYGEKGYGFYKGQKGSDSADDTSEKHRTLFLGDEDFCESDPFGFAPVLDKISVAGESEEGTNNIRILCFVNTHEKYHDSRVQSILKTWGPACDNTVFASSADDESIGAFYVPNVTDYSYDGLWGKHRETLRYIYNEYQHEYDWFFKADDDTYVIMENLREFLNSEQVQKGNTRGTPLHIGNPVSMYIDERGVVDDRNIDDQILGPYLERSDYKFTFNVGGAGYVMNHAFLKNIVDWVDRDECGPTKEQSTLLDDTMLSLCSSNFGVYPYAHTRDEDGHEIFHQDSPRDLYLAVPGTRLNRQYSGGKQYTGGFQYGEDCCSKRSISFHHVTPDEIRAMHKMLYGCRGRQPYLPSDHKVRRHVLEPWKAMGDSPSWPPLATTLRIAGRSKKAVIVILNCGVLDVADNLISSIVRYGVQNYILIPLDLTTYEVLVAAYPDNVIPPPPQFQMSENRSRLQPATWGTSHFRNLSTYRAWILLQFLGMGISILYNDVDMVWKANLFDILEKKQGESIPKSGPIEAVFMEDRYGYKDHICSCFLYFKPTPMNQRFVSHWDKRTQNGVANRDESDRRTAGRPGDDQYEMNMALVDMEAEFTSYRVLNGTFDHFPTGKEYFDEWSPTQKSEALLIHNNWIITKWRKYFRFKREGLWNPSGRLDGIEYQCESGTVTRNQALSTNKTADFLPNLSNQSNNHHNKTLVVLLGTIRGGEPAWNSLYRHVLEPNNADLALVLGAKASSSSLLQRATYIWSFPEYDDWNVAFDDTFDLSSSSSLTTEEIWRRLGSDLGGFSPFGAQSGGTILGYAKAILLDRLRQFRLLSKYDWFIVTRADQYYECDFDVSILNPSNVYVPTGEDWGGICDRFVATGRDKIEAVLNTHLPAIQNPDKYYYADDASNNNPSINAESFIKLRWKEEGIWDSVYRFRRIMFTAYEIGAKSRWLGGGQIRQAFIENGTVVNLKYVDEYYQAMTCKDFREPLFVVGREG